MTQMEHKAVPVGGVEVVDEEEGIVSAIVSVTGIEDRVKDIIVPGAYKKTLLARKPKGVWHHDTTKPVSKTLDIKELMPGDPGLPDFLPDGSPWPKEAGALKVLTQFNLKGERGRQAYADVVFFGPDQEWSIGYRVPTGMAEMKNGIRYILEQDLFEYSPVLFGAMPVARSVTTVKESQERWMSLKSALSVDVMERKDDQTDGELAQLVTDLREMISDEDGLTPDEMDSFWKLVDSINDLADEVSETEVDPDFDADLPADDEGEEPPANDEGEEPPADDEGEDDSFEDELAQIVMGVLEEFGDDDDDDPEGLADKLLEAINSFDPIEDEDEEKSIRRFIESMVSRDPGGRFAPKGGGSSERNRAAARQTATGVGDGVLGSVGWKRAPYAEDFAREQKRIKASGALGAAAVVGGAILGHKLGRKYGKQLGVLAALASVGAMAAGGSPTKPFRLSFGVDKDRLAAALRFETGSAALERGTREVAETYFSRLIDRVAGGGVSADKRKDSFAFAVGLPDFKLPKLSFGSPEFRSRASEWTATLDNARRGVYNVKADVKADDMDAVINYLTEVGVVFDGLLEEIQAAEETKSWNDVDALLDLHDLANDTVVEPLDEMKADDETDLGDFEDPMTDEDLNEALDAITQEIFGDTIEGDVEGKDFDDWSWVEDFEEKRFDPAKHPRGADGKFTRVPGSGVARGFNSVMRKLDKSNKLIPKALRPKLAKKRFQRGQKMAWRRERIVAKVQKRQPSRQLARLEAAYIGAAATTPDERQAYLASVGITSLNDLHRSVLRDFRRNGASQKVQDRVDRNIIFLSDRWFRSEKSIDWELEQKLDDEIADWDEEYVLDLMAKMDSETLEALIEAVDDGTFELKADDEIEFDEFKAAPISDATGGRVAQPGKGNKGNIRPILRWFERGEGAAKIRWGTKGDFMRCVRLASKHMTPERAKGFCNKRHVAATGSAPGQGPHAGRKDDTATELCLACGGGVVDDICGICLGDWGQKGLRRFVESMVKRSNDGKFSSKGGGGKGSRKKKVAGAAAVGALGYAVGRRREKKKAAKAGGGGGGAPGPNTSAIRHRGRSTSWVDTIDSLADMAGDPDSLLNFMIDKKLASRKRGETQVNAKARVGSMALHMRGKFDAEKVGRGFKMASEARKANDAALKGQGKLPSGQSALPPPIKGMTIDLDADSVRVKDVEKTHSFGLSDRAKGKSDREFADYLKTLDGKQGVRAPAQQGRKDDEVVEVSSEWMDEMKAAFQL